MKVDLGHRELEELLGAYALDALDADEADAVERHLPSCARCRGEVEEYREVAALLAHTGAAAPEGLWDRIAQSLDGEVPDIDVAPALPFLPPVAPAHVGGSRLGADLGRHGGWPRRAAGAVMAAAAAVIVVLGVEMASQDQRLDQMAALLSVDALERAYQAAEATPGSERIELLSFDGQVDTRAVVTEEGVGYLWAADLPRLEQGRTYQLWGDMGDRRVSLGPLGSDPHVVPFEVSEQLVGVAITEEAEPGVIASDQPVLAHGLLPE